MLKRIFDLVLAVAGLIMLFPVFILLGIFIRTDGGPVFFRQARVGRRNRMFKIFKFRSMRPGAEKSGALLTAATDPRITKIGKFLRRTKLDELPQLLNVIRGDMSFVGPRPEVPRYVAQWGQADRNTVLSVRPGITDYATFLYNDEQAFLAEARQDAEKVYLETVMPHKLTLYRQYVRDRDFWLDLRILAATLGKMAGLKADFWLPGIRLPGK